MNTDNKNTDKKMDKEREEIETLLPWYAAGTLDGDDSARVSAYLKRHPDMSFQLDLIGEERDATVLLNEALGSPGADALDRLMRGIEAEAGPAKAAASGPLRWLADIFGPSAATPVRWAAAAAVVLIMVQAAALGVMLGSGDQGRVYRTASGAPAETITGAYALVRFKDGATAREINTILTENSAIIVDGPKPGGLFKLRLADKALDEQALAARLQALRASDVVGFAAPAEQGGE